MQRDEDSDDGFHAKPQQQQPLKRKFDFAQDGDEADDASDLANFGSDDGVSEDFDEDNDSSAEGA